MIGAVQKKGTWDPILSYQVGGESERQNVPRIAESVLKKNDNR